MRNLHGSAPRLAILLALAGLVAACSEPGGGSRPEGTPGGPAGGDAAATEAGDAPYAPANDPLVNPPTTFEVAPADTRGIAGDETLYRNIDGNPSSLNPLFQSSTYEFYLAGVLYDGLFTFDKDLNWMVNESVVESFEESPDHRVYTVRMRPGLTWHDGHPWTAEDVCFSYEQILDERVPCPAVRTGTDQIESCEVVDELTVRFVHREALPTNPWNALFPIIPKHVYEVDKDANPDLKSGDYYNEQNRSPVGNGPYRFVRWLDNDKIEIERWDDFHGDRPHFRRMVFRIIPDNNILLLTFNKGDIDEFRLTAKQFATQTLVGSDFADRGGIKVLAPKWEYSYIAWNMDGSNPFFDDVRVRRAMTLACDIERMRRNLTYSLYTQCHGIAAPGAWYHDEDVELLPFDRDQASALLDEAGWHIDEDREGWRYKEIDGQSVKFEFELLIPQGSALGRDVAAIFQEDLQGIGVSMVTRAMEWATFQQRTRKHEFQASTAAWGTGTDPDTLWNLWHSESYVPDGSAGRNYVGFRNDRVDQLFEMGRREFDRERRAEIYQEIHRIVYDEQPYTFLFNRPIMWALDGRIRGVTTSPRGVFNFTPAEQIWWIAAGQQRQAALGAP